ncbi:MAG: COX15/CtaA family protein [Bacteroidia bacterium]|nr:COX15/CtaA family protein [Bacteroidia bacterium]
MENATLPNSNKAIIRWLLTGCVLVYIMVVVGCLTRLTHSGLSITDWNFMGSMPPLSQDDWFERFQKYQTSPEFIYKNSSMSMEEFKSIFWWEYIHRSIGNTMMGVFLIGFIWFLIKKKFDKPMLWKAIFLFVLGGFQGLIGWWMVKSGLVKNPNVSHYRLAIHLMSAFSVFAFTFWFALQLIYPKENVVEHEGKKLRNATLILFAVLILQIIYGAFVAGLKAGLFYPTWPKMGAEWFPEDTIMIEDSFIKNFLEVGAGVQFMHRTIAFLVVACVAWLWNKSSKLNLTKQQNLGINLLIFGVTIQFMLGIFTLLYQVPVALGALHQTGAFFLFATCIYLLFHLNLTPRQAQDDRK